MTYKATQDCKTRERERERERERKRERERERERESLVDELKAIKNECSVAELTSKGCNLKVQQTFPMFCHFDIPKTSCPNFCDLA
jgi:hypothetical protein